MIAPILAKLAEESVLDEAEIAAAFDALMDGAASLEEAKAFLTLTAPLMNDPQLIASGARALRTRMTRVTAPAGAIDVCGTGGDGAGSLNVSTAVAFVVAGAGVTVAKHGNRAMSSKSGAADVLEALGVKLTGDPAVLSRALAEARVAFLFAQNHHAAMRHVAQARRELGFRTIFNLLGPLSNPASVSRQLIGVFAPDFTEPMAQALAALGGARAMVVHGAGGLDELTWASANRVAAMENGAVRGEELIASKALGREIAVDPAALAGGDAKHNAHALEALLDGAGRQAYRETVLLNAAAALLVAGAAVDLRDGYDQASEALANGAARAALDRLVALTKDAP